jgi:hypothetical protein
LFGSRGATIACGACGITRTRVW